MAKEVCCVPKVVADWVLEYMAGEVVDTVDCTVVNLDDEDKYASDWERTRAKKPENQYNLNSILS